MAQVLASGTPDAVMQWDISHNAPGVIYYDRVSPVSSGDRLAARLATLLQNELTCG
jgi:hypothetical protein